MDESEPTHEETVLFRGAVRMHEADDYVRVWFDRPAANVSELAEMTRALERSLRDAQTNRVLMDSRDSQYHQSEIQQRLWEWLDQCALVARVAFLVRSANYAKFINDSGVGPNVAARALHEESQALAWLREA